MKVAVIGAGNWGKNLVRTFAELGALGAVVDPSPKIQTEVKALYPAVSIYNSLEAIRPSEIGAVAIATPASTHHDLAKRALSQGMDVFVEKPMTLSLAEAQELGELSQKYSRVLMVGHLLLYAPAIRWMKNFIQEDGLGKIYSIHQERLNLGRVRSVENALWSLGVHDIAVILHLVGNAPLALTARGQRALQSKVDDDVYLHLQFSGGLHAHLHTSWLWPVRRRQLTIVGEKGMLTYDESDQKVILHRKTVGSNLSIQDQGSELVFHDSSEPLRLELEHFLARTQDRALPLSNYQNGIDVMKVLELASRQLEAQ